MVGNSIDAAYGEEPPCETDRGYLGLGFTYKAGPEHGEFLVVGLAPGGAAARSGILKGDLIYEVNDTRFNFTSEAEIRSAFDWVRPSQAITFHVLREGTEQVITLTADCMSPATLEALEPPPIPVLRGIVSSEEFRRRPEIFRSVDGKPLTVRWDALGELQLVSQQAIHQENHNAILEFLREFSALERIRERVEPGSALSVLFQIPSDESSARIEIWLIPDEI